MDDGTFKDIYELLELCQEGNLKKVKQKMNQTGSKNLASVWGLEMMCDLKFDKEEATTLMWTPLHFAVNGGHFGLLKYFIDEY